MATDRKPFAARNFEFDNKTLTIYTNFNFQAMPILQFNLKMFRTLCEDVTVIFDNSVSGDLILKRGLVAAEGTPSGEGQNNVSYQSIEIGGGKNTAD